MQLTRHELKRLIAAKRTVLICVLVACAIALTGILSYIIYDHKRKEAFENGYFTEVLYTYTVEGTPPPEPEGTRVYTD